MLKNSDVEDLLVKLQVFHQAYHQLYKFI